VLAGLVGVVIIFVLLLIFNGISGGGVIGLFGGVTSLRLRLAPLSRVGAGTTARLPKLRGQTLAS